MIKEDLNTFDWLFEPKYRWVRHLLFWGFMYIDPLLSLFGITDELEDGWLILPHLLLPELVLVYLNLLIFVPLFLFKNRFFSYLLASLITLLLSSGFSFMLDFPYDNWEVMGENSPLTAFLTIYFLDSVQLVGTAVALKIFIKYVQKQKEIKELENKNLATELAYLKNQINPHFLFNALNNIAVQAERYPEKVYHSVILLSRLLRHQLYEGEKEAVRLRDEIEHLKNFLELNVSNLENTKLNFEVKGNLLGITVAPFLFLPFVENAAKHSRQVDTGAYIDLLFDVNQKQIFFKIINSKPKQKPTKIAGGIGLVNVKRRLELRYPESHQLNITENDESFEVELGINYLS